MKKHLSEETREQKSKRWLMEDLRELLDRAKKDFTKEEFKNLLKDYE